MFTRCLLICAAINSYVVHGMPDSVEFIFISPEQIVTMKQILKHTEPGIVVSNDQLALANPTSPYECVPMGDGCFHPQLGFIEKDDALKMNSKTVKKQPKPIDKLKLKTINAMETDLIDCDPNNYFDIYCGKTKPGDVTASVEIWVDISGSLRSIDHSINDVEHCNRRVFVEEVLKQCPNNSVYVSVFNTHKKEMGDLASVCMSYGVNDTKAIIRWLKNSDAKKVIVITDINELSMELRSFLEMNNVTMLGVGTKGMGPSELKDHVGSVVRECKKRISTKAK
ncbi:MAG: hypothetical protein ISR65_04765 [Bacteriovoracaceae bacterium]|nr:hypothetical protein [Bacteriovoracaceae bacterium]